MFKSVEYAGFDGHPELKAKAEQLTPVLANEIRTWRDDVEVKWSPHPNSAAGVLDLMLSLTLPNGVGGSSTLTFTQDDFAQARRLESRCWRVWDDLLGVLLGKQHKRVEEGFLETVEA